MIPCSLLFTLVFVLHLALGSPLVPRHDYAVKETHNPPTTWTIVGEPDPLHLLKLKIGLVPRNFHLLKQHLDQGTFSTPFNRHH